METNERGEEGNTRRLSGRRNGLDAVEKTHTHTHKIITCGAQHRFIMAIKGVTGMECQVARHCEGNGWFFQFSTCYTLYHGSNYRMKNAFVIHWSVYKMMLHSTQQADKATTMLQNQAIWQTEN